MKKTLQKSSLFLIGILISFCALADKIACSISFQTIPTGAYGKGSSIAVLFTPAGAYAVNNTTFNLYLSDPDGNFNSTAANTPIGSAQTHYITFINGLIPANAAVSNTYKLKITAIETSSGQIQATNTSIFSISIQNTNGTNGDVTNKRFTTPIDLNPTINYTINNSISLFGRCIATSDDVYVSNNTASTVTLSVKNEYDTTSITAYNNDPFATQNQNVTITANQQRLKLNGIPQKVHYRFFQTITDASQSNTISTKAYFFMNNNLSAPFSALLSVVCYETGSPGIFTFKTDIDPDKDGSVYFNYPGNIYTAKWDDSSPNYVTTIQDIIDKSGLLTHAYSQSSCGKTITASNGTFFNSFGPSMTVSAPSNCSQTQEALTPIQIFPKPKISFTGPPKGCLGTSLTFTNTSIISPQGSKLQAGCSTPDMSYFWFVDDIQVATSKDFTTSFLTVGNHKIQLVAGANGTSLSCSAAPFETQICIESAPPADAARFALIHVDNIRNLDTTICPSNNPFLVVNKSSTLTTGTYCSNLNYNWKLIGPAGFSEINSTVNSNSPNFTVPSLTIKGDYTLTLTVSNPCGTSNAFIRKITVLERPAFTTEPTDQTVCEGQQVVFSGAATGSNLIYKWQVSTNGGSTFTDLVNGGIYSGVTTNTLTINPTSVSMNGYRYKLVIVGSCTPDKEKIVLLTVNPRPTSVISGTATVCANTPTTISIALTGTAPWIFTYSDGSTTSAPITANASPYTFSVSLSTSKTYTVESLTDAKCASVAGDRTGSAIITVNPLPSISGVLSTCVGSTTQLAGTATANSTNPWSSASTNIATINNAGLVTGIAGGTSVITYRNSNNCITTATVTIFDLPTVTIPTTTQDLCRNSISPSPVAISPPTTTNGTGTSLSYQWFSNNTNSNTNGSAISGATSRSYTPSTANTGETYYYLRVTNNNACSATSNVSGIIKVYSAPSISASPVSANYCKDASATALSITDNNGGYGTLSYQWYSNTTNNNTTGSLIAGATNATYTPPTNVVGTRFYYVVINNGGPTATCNTATSSTATINVYAAPVVTAQPATTTSYCKDATVTALSVTGNNGGIGTPTYQWFSNTSNSNTGGTLIAGETNSSYTPSSATTGTFYFYVEIRNGATGGAASCNTTASNPATIIIHPLPVTTSTFGAEDLCVGGSATPMVASATTATGTITGYQWYSNSTASNTTGTAISGATNASFTPPTTSTGTTYYFCEITNIWGCKTRTAVSGAIRVFAAPIISAQTNGANYCQNATPTALSVTATNGGLGNVTYQWFRNANNANTGGTSISGATNSTYTPPTSTPGTTYYYVEVSNGGTSGCNKTASNAV
ncbi:MAG: hypothetical protein RL544_1198, partial [Bacteroidota bacterium]